MRTVAAIAAALTLTGCASSIDKPLAARVGLPITTVIAQMGQPTHDRVINGKQVYTWVSRASYQGNAMECEASYTVNDAGTVVDYDWRGQLMACNF